MLRLPYQLQIYLGQQFEVSNSSKLTAQYEPKSEEETIKNNIITLFLSPLPINHLIDTIHPPVSADDAKVRIDAWFFL